jgi:putative ABC transporter, ATP-binding protein
MDARFILRNNTQILTLMMKSLYNEYMVDLKRISYETGNRELFRNVSFTINAGDKIGLVGPNGVGKTTLLKIINGDLKPTFGNVILSGEKIGILPQNLNKWLDKTVYSFIEEVTGVKSAREEFAAQCERLAQDTSENTLLNYNKALEQYEKFEVANFDATIKKALSRATLRDINPERRLDTFSGGQRTRIALAAIFASRYDLILLDEPTNNLDDNGVALLEDFISNSPVSFLIVSHDRRFLRNATKQIIELVGNKGINKYNLGYDEYIKARAKDRQAMINHYEQYEKEKKRLRRVARDAKIRANSAGSNRKKSDGDKLNEHFRKERASSNLASASSGAESRLQQLDEPERVEDEIAIKFTFDEVSSKKCSLVSVRSLSISHDGKKIIGPVTFNVRPSDRILIQGENGSGKSSLLNLIMDNSLSYRSGEVIKNENVKTIYMNQSQTLPLENSSPLDNLRHLSPELELHDAINTLIRFGLDKRTISSTRAADLSGGERAKVLLAAMSTSSPDLIILDEPTNNLDIPTIEALELALNRYRGGVVVVSHDRDFVENIGITKKIKI